MTVDRMRDWYYPGDISTPEETYKYIKKHYAEHQEESASRIVDFNVLFTSNIPWYDVREYGAIGDGTTEDTTAIRAAATAASTDGGVVFFPPGTFYTDEIYYASNVIFKGSGIGVTTLKLKDSADACVFTRSDAHYADAYGTVNTKAEITNVQILDMSIDGNEANQSVPGNHDWKFCILFQRVTHSRIANVEIYDGYFGGICLHQSKWCIVENCQVTNCVQKDSLHNQIQSYKDFDWTAGESNDKAGGNHIFRNNFVDVQLTDALGRNYGISAIGTYGDLIDGNIIIPVSNWGLGAESSWGCRIANNYVFGLGINMNDFITTVNPEGNIIANNYIYAPDMTYADAGYRGIGIHVTDNIAVNINNNHIWGASVTGATATFSMMYVNNSARAAIIGNVMRSPDAGILGLVARSSARTSAIGNLIESNDADGIQWDVTDGRIIGNEVKNVKVSASDNGIEVTDDDNIVSANQLRLYTVGILETGSNGNRVTSNICALCTTDITIVGADTVHGLNGKVILTAWVPASGIRAPGTKPATWKEWGISGVWEFSDATDDTLVANLQFPYDMDKTVAPSVSVGWSTNTAVVTETARWQLEYLYTAQGEDTTAGAQATIYIDSDAVAQADGLVVATFPAMAVPGAADVCVHMRIKRLGATDDLTDTAELHGLCMGYTSNKLGA